MRNIPLLSLAHDELLNSMQYQMQLLEKYIGTKLFFPAPNLLFKYPIAKKIIKRIRLGANLTDLDISYKVNF